MKKILLLFIFIYSFIFINISNAKNTKLSVGMTYNGAIKYKFLEYELPEGEWEFYDRYFEMIDELPTVRLECLYFIQKGNVTIKAAYEICEINIGGLAPNQIGSFFVHEWRKGKYDSCILRPEYFYTKLFTRGGSSNCFMTRHIDVEKELYFPDDPQDVGGRVILEKYIKKNNLELPKIMLSSMSWIGVPSIRDKFIGTSFMINPELYGAPDIINANEEKSEYHRDNINKYPIQKKFFRDWTIEQAAKHKQLEKKMRLKSHHKLNFTDLN